MNKAWVNLIKLNIQFSFSAFFQAFLQCQRLAMDQDSSLDFESSPSLFSSPTNSIQASFFQSGSQDLFLSSPSQDFTLTQSSASVSAITKRSWESQKLKWKGHCAIGLSCFCLFSRTDQKLFLSVVQMKTLVMIDWTFWLAWNNTWQRSGKKTKKENNNKWWEAQLPHFYILESLAVFLYKYRWNLACYIEI